MWNANVSDRKIPFTDQYVNLFRYLNNTHTHRVAALGTEQRAEPVLFAAQE